MHANAFILWGLLLDHPFSDDLLVNISFLTESSL